MMIKNYLEKADAYGTKRISIMKADSAIIRGCSIQATGLYLPHTIIIKLFMRYYTKENCDVRI